MRINKFFLLIVALSFRDVSLTQQLNTVSFNVYSISVKDSFTIRVTIPARETMNHILKGAGRMKKLPEQRQYKGLRFEYFEHKGKAHFSQIPVSLSYILTQIDF